MDSVMINIDNLLFDPENPRLPRSLNGSVDSNKTIDYMVRTENVTELMQSIGELGYSNAEPLLVVPILDSKDNFIVVEGNRRLAALKLLSSPESSKLRSGLIKQIVNEAKFKPKEAPVIVYKTRAEILDYLGYRHITGVKDWGPLEKARYLDQLYQIHSTKVYDISVYTVLAKMIGSRADYVAKLHTALKLYDYANNEAYFGVDIEEQDFDFSWLTTALSFTDTVKFLGLETAGDSTLSTLDKENYKKLFIWMFDPKHKIVKDSRQISELNQILASPDALEKLKQGLTITEALLYTSAPNKTFSELLDKAKFNLQSSKSIIEQLISLPENSITRLEEIEKLSKTIRGALQEIFDDQKEVDPENISQLTPEQLKLLLKLIKK